MMEMSWTGIMKPISQPVDNYHNYTVQLFTLGGHEKRTFMRETSASLDTEGYPENVSTSLVVQPQAKVRQHSQKFCIAIPYI